MKKTDGFTLVELMVGILCSAIVTGAIITFMLMGMKTNRTVIDANVNQRNARIVISLMEDLASEGSIVGLKVDGDLDESAGGELVDHGDRSWELLGGDPDDPTPLLSYSPATKTIYTQGDSVLMEGVKASMLTLSKAPLDGYLIGFGLQTEDAFYQSSVYSRASDKIKTDGLILDNNNFEIIDSERLEAEPDLKLDFSATEDSRKAFLEVLTSQYGSTGMIISNGTNTFIPYSYWFSCVENGNKGYLPGWDENTPWCAIFLSWAFASIGEASLNSIPREAEVYHETDRNLWDSVTTYKVSESSYIPVPGDLVFFDTNDDDSDLEHVGAVLYRDAQYLYTIEGNSGGRVNLRRYACNDSTIHGYGILDWVTS